MELADFDAPDDRRKAAGKLPLGTRVFHWAMVLLLVVMYGLILAIWRIGPDDRGAALVDIHRSIGLTLLVLMLLRLGWRATHPLPPLVAPVWERGLAGAVQAGLYIATIAMPLLGWAASDASGDTITLYGVLTLPSVMPMDEDLSDRLFQLHGTVAIVLLALVALHVAGALRHRFVKRDGVFERMV